MNNLKVAILAAVILILTASGVFYFYQQQVARKTTLPSPLPSPQEKFPTAASPSPVLGAQPETGFDTSQVKNIGITILEPTPSNLISSPVKVMGKANVFEGKVIIRIKDANGKILSQGKTTACMDLDACPFEAQVSFSIPQTQTGTVEVYSPSPIDASESYLQTILVKFK